MALDTRLKIWNDLTVNSFDLYNCNIMYIFKSLQSAYYFIKNWDQKLDKYLQDLRKSTMSKSSGLESR